MRTAVHHVKDINGDICFISEAEITKIVAEGGITFFGLTLSETRSLRLLVDYLGWSLPLEEDKIKQLMDKLDDSIKLYGDFLQKAREELVEKGRFCSNEVNVTYSIYKDNLHDTTCCHYNIVINGKLLQDKFELSSYYYSDRYEFFTELKQYIVEAISNYVIMIIDTTSEKIPPSRG